MNEALLEVIQQITEQIITQGIAQGVQQAIDEHLLVQRQKVQQKLAENLDDSSDEDDAGMDCTEFEMDVVNQQYNQHKKSLLNNVSTEVFSAQYLGNSLFHTKAVQSKYKELKRQYLYYDKDIAVFYNNFKCVLTEIIESTINGIFYLKRNHPEQKFIDALRDGFKKKIKQDIEIFCLDLTNKFIAEYLKQNHEFNFDSYNCFFERHLTQYLNDNTNINIDLTKKAQPFSANITNLTDNQIYKKYVENNVFKSNMDNILSTPNIQVTQSNNLVKKVSKVYIKSLLKNTMADKSILQKIVQDIENISNRKQNRLTLPQMQEEIAKKYYLEYQIQLMINAELSLQDQSIIEQSGTNQQGQRLYKIKFHPNYVELRRDDGSRPFIDFILEFKENLREYIPYTVKDIKKELEDKVIENNQAIAENDVKNIFRNIQRPILPDNFQFNANNPVEFIAYLRLSNRSMKRKIKNMQIIPSQPSFLINTQTFFSCQFPSVSQPILETHDVTTSDNHARTDLVVNAGSYQVIQRQLCSLVSLIQTNLLNGLYPYTPNQIIAITIREIIQGKKFNELTISVLCVGQEINAILPFLANIAYLIIGTESVRNPSSFIINQMMLDLIENNRITWNELTSKMPMAPNSSVSFARAKHNLLKDIPHCEYNYSGEIKKTLGDLLQLETNIFTEWRNSKKTNETMSETIKRWYGPNIFS